MLYLADMKYLTNSYLLDPNAFTYYSYRRTLWQDVTIIAYKF